MPDYESTLTDDGIDEDVDFDGNDSEDDEVEFVPDASGTTNSTEPKAAKVKKEPARGNLPDGYVTPVGLAHKLNDEKLGKYDEHGNYVDIPPQQVYSYIRNAPKDYPFPLETVTDSIGKDRQAVKVDEGLDWWRAKNERAAARKANAATKAAAKTAKAESTEQAPSATAEEAVTEEAE